jgi:hypothetical protein
MSERLKTRFTDEYESVPNFALPIHICGLISHTEDTSAVMALMGQSNIIHISAIVAARTVLFVTDIDATNRLAG